MPVAATGPLSKPRGIRASMVDETNCGPTAWPVLLTSRVGAALGAPKLSANPLVIGPPIELGRKTDGSTERIFSKNENATALSPSQVEDGRTIGRYKLWTLGAKHRGSLGAEFGVGGNVLPGLSGSPLLVASQSLVNVLDAVGQRFHRAPEARDAPQSPYERE